MFVDLTTPEGPHFAEALNLRGRTLPLFIYADGGTVGVIIQAARAQDDKLLRWINHYLTITVRYYSRQPFHL